MCVRLAVSMLMPPHDGHFGMIDRRPTAQGKGNAKGKAERKAVRNAFGLVLVSTRVQSSYHVKGCSTPKARAG